MKQLIRLKKGKFIGLLFLILSVGLVSHSQNEREITGKVTDQVGVPLPGVSVLLLNTSIGTQTDFDGKYSISAKKGDVLVFSFIGMKSTRNTVVDNNIINVQMEEDAAVLDEVVVVGYGTRKKSDVTGSMARVNTQATQSLPNTNVLQSLKGTVAGLTIGTPNRPGEEPIFRVRGTNSISASNRPLIVVDGIIYNGSLNDISNNDIQSVDVLKDASAAAVYGSRSANGVIIISTKRGVAKKPTFNFSTSYGFSDPVKLIPVLSPEGYLQKILDIRIATGQEADPNNISDYLTITESNNLAAGRTVDWYDRLVKTSITKTYAGSVSGRTDKTNYFLSGSYFDQEGIVENDNFKRFTARANFSNDLTDWFNVSLNTSITHKDYSGSAVPLRYGLSPYSNYYEDGADSGELEYFPMEDPFFRHPELNLRTEDFDKRLNLFGLVSAKIKVPFVKGLKYTMNYSLSSENNRRNIFNDNTLSITNNGSASKTISEQYTWTFDNILNYDRIFNNVHSVSATFLLSREYQNATSTNASSTDFFSQVLGYNSLELGAVPSVNSGFGEQNQNAIMGRLNYAYDNKYAITGTVRKDGYSGFSQTNKYATFYSGGISWTVSNENFLKNSAWLNLMKLRFSYGENGNQAIGRYRTLARITANTSDKYVFGDGGGTSNGVAVSTLANNELSWETTDTYNLGLDFGFFNRRLSGSIDVYSSRTKDLLLNRQIPSLTGFRTILTNVGEVSNKGIEVALNATPVMTDDFSWDIGVVFDKNNNKIESLFGVDDDGDGVEDDDIANGWFIGKPLGAIYGYAIDGIHQIGDTDIPSGYEPGDFRIVDYNNNGEVDVDDRHILGYYTPNYQFSVTNTFKYKNVSLFVRINSVQGGGKDNHYVGNNIIGHSPNAPFASWSDRFSFPAMDYWTPTNPSNTAARVNYTPTRGHPYLEDRSFVRLQDVILSYAFDKEVLEKLKIDGLSLNLNAKNLHTWTKWTGYDPETTRVGNSTVYGTTINNSPLNRTFTLGLDLTF
ncbi:SusC/RagA family TonB-linked outer membrane protein [Flavivirga rizhaonensis]|uniref:TonB-dependent receptor n=1 Tax=Flavivirga rizhaonensis TaxID=2559571 RepID=A0A4S1E283_9FLAO|nr:TonB-dependent receptor [Flavivirga rizhaonensis]TGV04736.1 TonB-dependent receptor [Flavivirga rizhaonensis]